MKFRSTFPKMLLLVLFISITSACAGSSSLGQATSTSPPEPTLTPTISPLEERMTDLADIETLCVTPENSHPAESVRTILAGAGYDVIAGETGCTAVLRIEGEFEALPGQYKNSDGSGTSTCYTGASVATTMILEIDGVTLAQSTDNGRLPPTSGMITRCPSKANAPYKKIWERTICTNLGEIFGPIPLLEVIRNEDDSIPANKADLAILITTDRNAAFAVPALIEELKDENPEVRKGAITALRQIGPEAEDATTNLIALLNDPEPDVAIEAATAIGRVATNSSEVIPPLMEALQSDEPRMRQKAAASLGVYGFESAEAIPILLDLLDDEFGPAQREAALALLKIGDEGFEESIPLILPSIVEANSFVTRRDIYNALEAAGKRALPAVPALIDAIEWEKIFVQEDLINALTAITGEDFGADQQSWQEWWESQE